MAQGSTNTHRRATREILQCVPYVLRRALGDLLGLRSGLTHTSAETAAEMMDYSRNVHKEIYISWIMKDKI